ncbi:hypothetical protein J6590_032032 [Homalodisca vitripennis]|nr:hypothetical protein J6590_032032 [Homalodisca vitripennis]
MVVAAGWRIEHTAQRAVRRRNPYPTQGHHSPRDLFISTTSPPHPCNPSASATARVSLCRQECLWCQSLRVEYCSNFWNKPRAIRFVWGSKSPGMLARLAMKALQCGPWVKKVGHP